LNYTSKIILAGFMIALFSMGVSNFGIQDAHAAANITYTADTTATDTITVTFSEAVRSIAAASGDWTISTGQTVTSIAHTNATTTMTLTLSYALDNDATPTLAYAENGNIFDQATYVPATDGSDDTPVTADVLATDGISFVATFGCYDCTAPKVQETQINISSDNYIITTGDEPIHITANVGDEVTVTLKVTDNKSIQSIPSVALYTNFEQKSSDMSLFYANNFDDLKQVSTSFYQWNIRSDDVAYDYDGTVSWSNGPNVTLNEEYLMVPFTFTINEHMQTSQVTAKIYDAAGNRLHVTLPVTLETAGNDPLNFDKMGKQKMLGFFDESVLSIMISELNTSDNINTPVSSLLGIPDESLPAWTSNLTEWMVEDKINSGDLIVAVEYLINQ
jgi:hypothetical protein